MGFFQFIGNNAEWILADEAGNPVLPIHSFIGIDVSASGNTASAPIEKGSFNSYNKTRAPKQLTIDVSFQGSEAELHEAIDVLDELQQSTNVFSIITPQYEFENYTLESYSFSQRVDSGGGGILFASLTCVEIQETAAAYSSVSQDAIQSSQASPVTAADAANPSDVSTVETGQVATATPTEAEESEASGQRESILYKINGGW